MGEVRRHIDRERRESAITVLLALKARGALTNAHIERVADELGAGQRTVWRWVATASKAGGPARRHRPSEFAVTDEDVTELAYWNGNVSALHRARRGRGVTGPSLPTLRRAFRRALSPGQLAGLAHGEEARRAFDTYLARAPERRNDCWETDHNELAVLVLLDDGRVVKPWLTSFIDTFSRALCGWAIAEVPSQESVFEALRAAILTEPPFGPFGGVPLAIRWDRGKEFLADAVATAAKALAIDARALPPYTPYLKGVIERVHESIETMLLAELPGYTHGPSGRDGKRIDAKAPLLTLDQFVQLFAEFAVRYNTEHAHAGLDGRTPLAAWSGDTTPLVEVPFVQLSHLLMARKNRTITKKGISLLGRRYNAAELVGRVGESVEIRYMPHRDGPVEVFRSDGTHLCRAWLVDAIEVEEMRRILVKRAEDARWLAREQRAAAARRRQRFAPMTAGHLASRGDKSPAAPTHRRLIPSRSLSNRSVIPPHMVRPLATPIPDGEDQ